MAAAAAADRIDYVDDAVIQARRVNDISMLLLCFLIVFFCNLSSLQFCVDQILLDSISQKHRRLHNSVT